MVGVVGVGGGGGGGGETQKCKATTKINNREILLVTSLSYFLFILGDYHCSPSEPSFDFEEGKIFPVFFKWEENHIE